MIAPRRGLPPRGMVYTGGGDFLETGAKFVSLFQNHANLQAHEDVMDIGSGIGRIAIPLSHFLLPTSHYYGFDLVALGVDWCSKNITTKHPNFHFKLISVENDLYTGSSLSASQFVFPYESSSVDFVCLISVFTHMLPSEVSHYLDEIYRCLRPGGRCFFSCFMFEDEGRLSSNKKFSFPYVYENYALMNKKIVSANVAIRKKYLSDAVEQSGLIQTFLRYGSWAGSNKYAIDFQDIIVLEKP